MQPSFGICEGIPRFLPGLLLAATLIVPDANGQYLGLNLRGDMGLKSGSQPHPGYYFSAPLWYRNDYNGLRNASGDEIASRLDVNINMLTIPAVAVVTNAKLFGANYGFTLVPAVMDTRLELAATGQGAGEGYGLADSYIQPISLGWHKPKADVTAAYGLFLPTGYGTRSLDMWAHEIVLGTTVYFDAAKNWSAATTGSYDIHQNKRGVDLRVGDILTLEGGVGRSFMKGAASAGVVYYAQWKVTDDSGADFPAALPKSKNKAYGIGPEINIPVFAKGSVIGLVGFRFLRDFGARTNFEGGNLVLSFTLAKLNLGERGRKQAVSRSFPPF